MKKRKIILLFIFLAIRIFTSAQTNTKSIMGGSVKQTLNLNRTIPNCNCLPVTITNQPLSPLPICVGAGNVQFTVSVNGTAPFTYQWRENGAIISDGISYSGTQSSVLTIHNPSYALNGKTYRCVISNCSGSSVITNTNVVLTIKTLPADLNHDGSTNVIDFFLINAVLNTNCNNCPEDFNTDGIIDNEDFLFFLGEFNQSCM